LPEIRNPNLQTQGPAGGGGGGDMRTTIGFTLLMLVVLFGYQYFFKPKQTETTTATQIQQQAAAQASAQATGHPPAPQLTAGAAQPAASALAITGASETQTTVENERVRIVFTNRGAQVIHWILKGFKDTSGQPLDMVLPQASAQFGLPLSLYTYEPALTSQLNQALLPAVRNGISAGAQHPHLPLRRQWPRRGENFSLRHRLRGQCRGAGKA